MAINAVQNNNVNNKMSYVEATSIGAITGYAAKYMIPINSSEKAEINNQQKQEGILLKTLKDNEIKKIKIEKPRVEGADEFIKIYDDVKLNKKNIYSEIKKIPKELQLHLKSVIARINNTALEKKLIDKEKLKAFNKSLRPTFAFICIGAIGGGLTALAYNLKNTQNKEDEEE